MTKIQDELKALVFGSIAKHISDSNITPENKNSLFTKQIWLKFTSWFLRVVVLGGIIIYLNDSYNSRLLEIEADNNSLKIDLKRYSFTDSLNSKYLDLYTKYEAEQRYRFLNHMRFTAPDTNIRLQYQGLFNEFMSLEGEHVKRSIVSSYETEVSEIDPKIKSKEEEFKRFSSNPSDESQAKANETEDELVKLYTKRDTYEQLIEKTAQHFGEIPTNEESALEEVVDEPWNIEFSLKQSFNTEYFIKYIAENKLVVGLKDVKSKSPKSALIFLRTGSFKNPSFYQEQRINLNEQASFQIKKIGPQEVPKNLSNKTITITLDKVWNSGIRKWVKISCSYQPNVN